MKTAADAETTGTSITASPIVQALKDYQRLERVRFHVPGHSGTELFYAPGLSSESYRYDLTEVEGLDVLATPSECIDEAQRKAAQVFGVRESYFLINGSSVGIQAAMLSALKPGDRVLVPRNAHRSVISGLILTGAEPVWMLPERIDDWELWGSVDAQAVEQQFQQVTGIRALVLTSPTYEGIASDIEAIGAICQQYGVLLIVDEAHGSLWSFSSALPVSACHQPCDAVIHSLHKSAGSLTQTAMAHLPEGSRLDGKQFQHALGTLQTTSPSYLLLASLDAAVAFLESRQAACRIDDMIGHVNWLRGEIAAGLSTFECYTHHDETLWDRTQLFIRRVTEPGEGWAYRVEQDHAVAFEEATPLGTLYKAGLGLKRSDYEALFSALSLEDDRTEDATAPRTEAVMGEMSVALPDAVLTPRDAFFASGERVEAAQSVGRVVKETVVRCPPGIPVLIPGERVQEAHRPYLPEFVDVVGCD